MKTIALIAGGYSGEYEISVQSAEQVYQNLKNKYKIYLIIIDKQSWYCLYDGTRFEVDKNDFSVTVNNEKIHFDAAFIIIHGTPGENGLLQGYLDMLNIPYNTCDALTSAVTFDKVICNSIVKQTGVVNVANNTFVCNDGKDVNISEILEKISLPVFVKPSQGGSSIATFKVTNKEDLLPKIKDAFKVHNKVMIEEYIKGREFSCGVIKTEGKIITFPVAEICPKTSFFDYQAKYEGLSDEIVPAEIDKQTTELIQHTTEKIYAILNCKGVCRVDYILQEGTNDLYFLEINTTPGQSPQSIVPKQVRCMGKTVKWLYKTQIEAVL